MLNEQRVQATLDFATRNAFETLNKFSQWASTPNAEVQFNLIDTIATLNNASNPNSRGVFLKPIKIPSLNSVTTGIFGPVGTDATRNLYWSINFQSNGTGWVFENYSQGSNSTGPKANNTAELKILVNTLFGSETKAITLTKRNVTENSYNSNQTLNGSNSFFKIIDDSGIERILLSSASSKILSDSIFLGNSTNSSSLSADFSNINIFTQTVSKNILSLEKSNNGNTVTIGCNDNSVKTIISGGNLEIIGNSNQNSSFSVLSQVKLVDAYYSKTYNIGFAVPLIDSLVDSVNIGSSIPSSITSTDVLGVVSVNIGATSSINAYSGTGGIFNLEKNGKFSVEGNQKIHGSVKNEISSGSAIYLGIDEGDGVTSKEISVTKGQVLIPNLYLSKKSNYILSGIKHLSAFNTNPSIKFIPVKNDEILNNTSTYTCEYTSKIQHTPTIRVAKNEFDTTINDHSGVLNSYIGKYSSDTSIEILSAPVATSGANQDKTIVSAYSPVTTTGLSSLKLPVSSQNRIIKLWSTPNYMYVFIVNSDGAIEIYYSENAVDFAKLGSSIQLSYPDFWVSAIDIDSVTQTTIDYIWLTVLVPSAGNKIDYDVPGSNYTEVVINVINNCGVTVVRKHNIEQAQSTFKAGDDTLIRSGNTCKISCSTEGSGSSVVAYTVQQYYGIHTEVKRSKSSLFSTLTGAVVGGITAGTGGALTGALLSNVGSSSTSRKESERTRIVVTRYEVNLNTNSIDKTVPFSQDSSMFVRDGYVADCNVNAISATPIVTKIEAYYSRPSDTYKVTFDNTTPSPTLGLAGSVAIELMDNSQPLNYSGVSFVNGVSHSVKKILTGRTNLWLNTGTGYNQVISAQIHDNMKILNDYVFAYFNSSTSAIQYYSTDSTPGIPLTSIQTYNVVVLKNPYDISGMYVDYVSLTGNQFDGYNSFVLSNTAQNNGVCEYSINENGIESVSDRDVSIESTNSNEIISILDKSDQVFTKRDISKIAKLNGPSNYILTATSKNAEYDSDFTLIKTSGNALNTVQQVQYSNWSLNVHLEPISYLIKNIKNSINTASIANYEITSTSITNTFLVKFSNNPYSGYRVSYLSDSPNQIADSNATGSAIYSAPLGVAGEDLNQSFYVCVGNNYTTVVRSDATNSGDISEISSKVFKTNHRIIKIHNSLIDPLNSMFDPTISVVNEFGNVVSVRMDHIGGFRSGPALRYNSQIVVGLTEIASTGEPCT